MYTLSSILFGFIISWVIGLTPALLYRYAIFKKPVPNKKAFWCLAPIVAILCILFKATVASLNNGGYNPNPIPWILIYWGGQWIMTRRGGKDKILAPSTQRPLSTAYKKAPSANVVPNDVPKTAPSAKVKVNRSLVVDAELTCGFMAGTNVDQFTEFADFWEGDMENMNDEKFYEMALDEVESEKVVRGLMAKAEIAAGGDDKKARLIYLQTRASQLYHEHLERVDAEEARTHKEELEREKQQKLERERQKEEELQRQQATEHEHVDSASAYAEFLKQYDPSGAIREYLSEAQLQNEFKHWLEKHK